jgi:kynureninase
MIALFDTWLAPLGFSLGSPRDAGLRGSHISLRHAEAFRITRALIETPSPAVRVIPDFRTPDNIRFGITPLYTSYMDIYRAMERLRKITENKLYEAYSAVRQKVT